MAPLFCEQTAYVSMPAHGKACVHIGMAVEQLRTLEIVAGGFGYQAAAFSSALIHAVIRAEEYGEPEMVDKFLGFGLPHGGRHLRKFDVEPHWGF